MMIRMSNTTVKKKKSRLTKEKKTLSNVNHIRRGLKRASGFAFALFINVLIVYALVKMFSYSFHFGYGLFGKVAKDPASREYVAVRIPPDSSALQIGKALEDAKIIDDKFIFFAKIKIKKLGGKLSSGEFQLSASMTYDEIIDILCPVKSEEEVQQQNGNPQLHSNEVVDTGTLDEADLTTEAEEGAEGEEGGEEPQEGTEEW